MKTNLDALNHIYQFLATESYSILMNTDIKNKEKHLHAIVNRVKKAMPRLDLFNDEPFTKEDMKAFGCVKSIERGEIIYLISPLLLMLLPEDIQLYTLWGTPIARDSITHDHLYPTSFGVSSIGMKID